MKFFRNSKIAKLFLFIFPYALIIVLYVVFKQAYTQMTERMEALSQAISSIHSELGSTTAVLYNKTGDLDRKASGLSDSLFNTQKKVETVQTRVGGFETTVGTISGAVNTLEKLSKTDKELLQKYSKVYFLNEHYIPDQLAAIDSEYAYSDEKVLQIHARVWQHLKDLLDAAKRDGIKLYVKSAYRSFQEQASIKSAYTVVYGKGTANQFSADQGYSEHQLGTTVDFITTGLGGELTGFEKTSAYQWLVANAHTYGFSLSYYKGNKYYMFEPWHWRYVGIQLAANLHHENKYFYDLDQRTIDTYLINIFD